MTTPKTTPPKATARPRATPKTRATKYTEEQRAEALRLVEAHGTGHAHRVTGVPKRTLIRWTSAAGIDTGATNRARTAVAVEATRARAAEVTASTVALLEQHIAQAGDYLATVAGVNAAAARHIAHGDPDDLTTVVGLAGPYVVIRPGTPAEELTRVAQALDTLPLAARDAEGIVTRAVHDLQLLRGEATERGELVVEFNVPRPTPGGTVVEAVPPALEE